jgi:hypothetical protein
VLLGLLPGGVGALQTEDVYEERIARFLELAEAAQTASERASGIMLKVTYARLASQWVELAQLAARTIVQAQEARASRDQADRFAARGHQMH